MPRKAAPSAGAVSILERKPATRLVNIRKEDTGEDIFDAIQDPDPDEMDADGGDEENMQDMLNMLEEFQKRNTAKTSTRSSAFQSQKTAIYAEARKNADALVRDCVGYIEQCRGQFRDYKNQESSHDKIIRDLVQSWNTHDEIAHSLLALYPPFFEDLSQRRAEEINAASSTLESHDEERAKSRRRLMKKAKAHLDEGLENQKIATDAAALIKHYKALLLS